MSLETKQIQTQFDRSAVSRAPVSAKLERLLELRYTDIPAYWELARNLPGPTPDDLEAALPSARLPKLADGMITFRCLDVFGEDRGKVVERQRYSESQSVADQFIGLIERLEREDPEFITSYFENYPPYRAMALVSALHLSGQREDLKIATLNKVTHFDDFVLEVHRLRETLLDNDVYPADSYFERQLADIIHAYVREKLPNLDKAEKRVPESVYEPVLNFIKDYRVDGDTLNYLNRYLPVPQGLYDIHRKGRTQLRESMAASIPYSLHLLGERDKFSQMTPEQKIEMGRDILDTLAHTYGFSPAPELRTETDFTSDGGHSMWDLKDKEACFAHPLGYVVVNPDTLPDDFNEFVETLCHEFSHGLEDATQMSVSAEFGAWLAAQGENVQVKLGKPEMLKSLRAAALVISFNVSSGAAAAFGQTREGVYDRGEYYSYERAKEAIKADFGADSVKKYELDYLLQVRERDAFLFQRLIAQDFGRSLDMTQKCLDPLAVFMMAQNAMWKAEAYIKAEIAPHLPEGDHECKELIDGIGQCFRQADARENTYVNRLRQMSLAFLDVQKLIFKAGDGGFIDSSESKHDQMVAEFSQLTDYTIHGMKIAQHVAAQNRLQAAPDIAPSAT